MIESDYGFLQFSHEKIKFLFKIFNLRADFVQTSCLLKPAAKMPTFCVDEYLPSLPVPDLAKTIDKYLASIKPFVDPSEYAESEKIANNFKHGIGGDLNKLLNEKAKHERNWVTPKQLYTHFDCVLIVFA